MEFSRLLSGGAPTIKKYQVAASVSVLGIPLLAAADATAGLALATTTSLVDMAGINLDLATYGTAQVAGGTPEALVSVIINPDAVLKIFMSGAATAGTAETTRAETTGSATGLTVTTGNTWNSPETDEGSIWGVSGANAGQLRKITSTGATSATVTVAFANDIAIGDAFGFAPVSPMTLQTITLTSDLAEFRQDVAVATNTGAMVCIELRPNNWLGTPGRPFGLFVARDHILNPAS